jgi:hypothetical protein
MPSSLSFSLVSLLSRMISTTWRHVRRILSRVFFFSFIYNFILFQHCFRDSVCVTRTCSRNGHLKKYIDSDRRRRRHRLKKFRWDEWRRSRNKMVRRLYCFLIPSPLRPFLLLYFFRWKTDARPYWSLGLDAQNFVWKSSFLSYLFFFFYFFFFISRESQDFIRPSKASLICVCREMGTSVGAGRTR